MTKAPCSRSRSVSMNPILLWLRLRRLQGAAVRAAAAAAEAALELLELLLGLVRGRL